MRRHSASGDRIVVVGGGVGGLGAAIRLALLAHHWRVDWEWHDEELEAAEQRLDRWAAWARTPNDDPSLEDSIVPWLRVTIASDLDTPAALQAVRRARLGAGPWYCWVAGEAGMVRGVRRHLLHERGFEREAVTFLGYWRAGRAADPPAEAEPAVR